MNLFPIFLLFIFFYHSVVRCNEHLFAHLFPLYRILKFTLLAAHIGAASVADKLLLVNIQCTRPVELVAVILKINNNNVFL